MSDNPESNIPLPEPSRAPWMTMQDVADGLGVSINTASKLLMSGKIRAYKVNRQWRITVDDYMAYLNSTSNVKMLKKEDT